LMRVKIQNDMLHGCVLRDPVCFMSQDVRFPIM
jgi:hypothetical protein